MLLNILVIGLCSVITGSTDFEDLGRDNEEWFGRFLELPDGDSKGAVWKVSAVALGGAMQPFSFCPKTARINPCR
ncbi:MAG: hypothetical protein FWB78_11335 [Treponema sp.]|nr:hypothetical protein [Treponema sp.]